MLKLLKVKSGHESGSLLKGLNLLLCPAKWIFSDFEHPAPSNLHYVSSMFHNLQVMSLVGLKDYETLKGERVKARTGCDDN